MEAEQISSLCRLCGTYSKNMIDVLNGYEDTQLIENQSNIIEIIHNCLPVQVFIIQTKVDERKKYFLSEPCNIFYRSVTSTGCRK